MLQDGALDTPLCRAGLAGELLTLSGQSLVALWENQVEGLRDDLHESKTMVEQYSKLVNKLAHHKPKDDCFIYRHTLRNFIIWAVPASSIQMCA
ncbi:MAG: hypothetical protein LBV76_02665 [Deltaproteobacteria bacterium]|nr:hypothetical protein [Deltaproteobacteria bacterium]